MCCSVQDSYFVGISEKASLRRARLPLIFAPSVFRSCPLSGSPVQAKKGHLNRGELQVEFECKRRGE